MKANQQIRLTQDTRAQVGIGTMIVFIATILVAATAAAVLLDTSGKLQERSSSTGNEATKQVASNLVLKQLYGDVSNDKIEDLTIVVGLAPGASLVDFAELQIVLIEGTKRADIDYKSDNTCGAGDTNKFCLESLRDPKGTYTSPGTPVLSSGGLIEIHIDLTEAGGDMGLNPRTKASVLLIPEIGNPMIADFTTPSSFGTDTVVMLR